MNQDMHETQLHVKSEQSQKEAPAQEPVLKSSFNDAEYQRWSENLRKAAQSKIK
jgi:hypothetical protein